MFVLDLLAVADVVLSLSASLSLLLPALFCIIFQAVVVLVVKCAVVLAKAVLSFSSLLL